MAVADAITALEAATLRASATQSALSAATIDLETASAALVGAEPGEAQDQAIDDLIAARVDLQVASANVMAANAGHTLAVAALETARMTLEEVSPDSLALIDAEAALAKAEAGAQAAAKKALADAEAAAKRAADQLAKVEKERDALKQELDDQAVAAAAMKARGLFAAIKKNVDVMENVQSTDPIAGDTVSVTDGVLTITKVDRTQHKLAASAGHSFEGPAVTLAFVKHYDDVGDRMFGEDGLLVLLTGGPELGAASSRFPENGGTVSYTDAAEDTDTPSSVVIPGTLMKASGEYTCDDPCSISEDGGKYTFTGVWKFDPDTGAMVTIPDSDYTQFGWWAIERADGTYRVDTFAFGSTGASSIDSLRDGSPPAGSATYTGSALGKYAIDNRPTGNTLEANHFQAAATLTADFGDNMISGKINKFMVDGEEKDWSVSLGKTAITIMEGNDFDSSGVNTPGVNVWTIGGVKGAANGDWMGAFFHDGQERNDGTPATVIGEYTASHGSTAYMVGAFGAENEAPDTPSTE